MIHELITVIIIVLAVLYAFFYTYIFTHHMEDEIRNWMDISKSLLTRIVELERKVRQLENNYRTFPNNDK